MSEVEMKRNIEQAVASYRVNPSATEHERLLLAIERFYGPDTAEFFDQEGCLPLSGSGGLGGYPWPMHAGDTTNYAAGVLMVCMALGVGAFFALASAFGTTVAALAGLGIGVVIWFTASPVIGRLFPRKDSAERHRLVEAFEAIGARNRDAADADAARARTAREFNRIITNDDQ